MRPIDADALVEAMTKFSDAMGEDMTHGIFYTHIAPTINAVPVIRCRDCKYWLPHAQFGFDEDNNEYHNYCERLVPDDDFYAFTREADEFCSRAVRKDNAAD